MEYFFVLFPWWRKIYRFPWLFNLNSHEFFYYCFLNRHRKNWEGTISYMCSYVENRSEFIAETIVHIDLYWFLCQSTEVVGWLKEFSQQVSSKSGFHFLLVSGWLQLCLSKKASKMVFSPVTRRLRDDTVAILDQIILNSALRETFSCHTFRSSHGYLQKSPTAYWVK